MQIPTYAKYIATILLTAIATLLISGWLISRAFVSHIVLGANLDAVVLGSIVEMFKSGETNLGVQDLTNQLCVKRKTLRDNLDNLSKGDRDAISFYLSGTEKHESYCRATEYAAH